MKPETNSGRGFEPSSDDDDDYKTIRFAQLYADNESYLRAYAYSIVPNWNSVDEIIQQASLVMWRKFGDLRCDSEFLKWAYAVTRFEILAFKRTKARNRLYFDSELIGRLTVEFSKDAERIKVMNDALASCYDSLPAQEREIAVNVFASKMKILDVAKMMGKEKSTFYKTVHRIRKRLMNCVERKLGDER